MRKLFISLPMRGRSETDIQIEMASIKRSVRQRFHEDFEVIDSYSTEEEPSDDKHSCWHLGRSISLLSQADLAAFSPAWHKAPGCRVEFLVCMLYDIPIVWT